MLDNSRSAEEEMAMRVETFEMERMQSVYEHHVRYNLTESGVWPMRLDELLEDDAAINDFLAQQAFYPEAPGSSEIRSRIAQLYPGAEIDNVTVTAGGSEANYTTLWSLLEPGDRAAIMVPNYMQAWGIVRAYAAADRFRMKRMAGDGTRRWGVDLDELHRAVTTDTKLIVVTNPNNPTGGVLTAAEMDDVVETADRVGAWLIADEIYRGAEVDSDEVSPTFWGRYDKVVVTSGVSKAFGLPGLRIGWIVAPTRFIEEAWRHHDYLSLMPSTVSLSLATVALEPAMRERIFARTRAILRKNLPPLERWISKHADLFDYIPPKAGAITYLPTRHRMNTRRLVERVREEASVLLVPGEQLGLSSGLRVGYGYDIDNTIRGLKRIERVLVEMRR
jgi:aspartate/methionine/tyrosine aminotransferase